MRTPLIAANWKMHMTIAPAVRLIEEVKAALGARSGVEVVICPPATALSAAGHALAGTPFLLGGQTMHWEPKGAYTGEVSGPMLVDVGCRFVIVGHSERRLYFGETDDAVGRKVRAAIECGLTPIVCVGERLEERQAGRTDAVITSQVRAALQEVPAGALQRLVVAYEPVWAIGTGQTATGAEANRVAGVIRRTLAGPGKDAAAAVRILYGGSVKPENIREFLEQPEIDGALVGGASLDVQAFAAIVRAAERRAPG
ncbi:MAG: triose-phosphate isomerase [Bacillati bacterium ANGP1]|uniref:Triosephosphate isomerase n=1 Tax=Candidatus Segetimicrobium genomatis TaxID=2569760 RepID=A0A537J8J7_9BACT|nr:MAG: triose-phosphate isomerase [Terrabacteria group bacterium ANGP1]